MQNKSGVEWSGVESSRSSYESRESEITRILIMAFHKTPVSLPCFFPLLLSLASLMVPFDDGVVPTAVAKPPQNTIKTWKYYSITYQLRNNQLDQFVFHN